MTHSVNSPNEPVELAPLPPLVVQAQRLTELGVPAFLGSEPAHLLAAAQRLEAQTDVESSASMHRHLLVPQSTSVNYSALMELVKLNEKPGFVVSDLTDIADFTATPESRVPTDLAYVVVDVQRGDEFQNDSPAEALATLEASSRTPLTMLEGILWLLQQPEALSRNNCFMTIASRKPKARGGYDSRTPALWISNGTGRDGAENRNAPKLGWCWWNNRHTWLGIAHAKKRVETKS